MEKQANQFLGKPRYANLREPENIEKYYPFILPTPLASPYLSPYLPSLMAVETHKHDHQFTHMGISQITGRVSLNK